MIIRYTVPEIQRMTDVISCFYFELLFALLKHLEISPFYPCVPKIMIIYYTVPEIQRMMDVIFIFYFELLFALLKDLGILPFYPCVPKIRIRWCMVPEILVQQTDGWTEKWHVEVGALHCFSLKIYGFCSSNALY